MPALNITSNQEPAKKKTPRSKKLKEDLNVESSKKFLEREKYSKTEASASHAKKHG